MIKILKVLFLIIYFTGIANAQEQVVNGDFQTGVIAPATSALTLNSNCIYKTYMVTGSVVNKCSFFTQPPGANGMMMVVDCEGYQDIWRQEVELAYGEVYTFEMDVSYLNSHNDRDVRFSVMVDNVTIRTTTVNGQDLGVWRRISGTYRSNKCGVQTLRIYDNTSSQSTGRDIAIDNVSLDGPDPVAIPLQMHFPEQVCENSEPFTPRLDPTATSGTWSASCGTCINPVTGVFDPSIAGEGAHTIYFSGICGDVDKKIIVKRSDFCCLDENVLADGIFLSGHYSVSNPLPLIPNGASVVLDGNVFIDDLTVNWDGVTVYAMSSIDKTISPPVVDGSKLTFRKCTVNIKGSTFRAACKKMWYGIVLKNRNEFSFNDNTITGAYKAVTVESYRSNNLFFNNKILNNYYSLVLDYKDDIRGNRFVTEFKKTLFDSDPMAMLYPYEFNYSHAHVYHLNSYLNDPQNPNRKPLRFEQNEIYNAVFGITAAPDRGAGMTVVASTFENCFVGAWYDGDHLDPTMATLINSTINLPDGRPQSSQFSTYPSTIYGIRRTWTGWGANFEFPKSAIKIEAFNSTFNSRNTATSHLIPDVGVASEYLADVTVDQCTFNQLSDGIRVKAFGSESIEVITNYGALCQFEKKLTSNVTITSNTFNDVHTSIRYLSNQNLVNTIPFQGVAYDPSITNSCNVEGVPVTCYNCPRIRTDLITNNVSCNEFVSTNGLLPNSATAIYISSQNQNANFGAYDNPVGNEIHDPSGLLSFIRNYGSAFNYFRYANELVYSPFFNSTGSVSIINTNTYATPTTCAGSPGVLRKTIDEVELYQGPSNVKVSVYPEPIVVSLSVYPNPTAIGEVEITTTGFVDQRKIEVRNVKGVLVSVLSSTQDVVRVDISSFAKGVYFIKVSDSVSEKVERLIVK